MKRCCGVCLVTGWMVVAGLQHSLTVVSQLAAKLNYFTSVHHICRTRYMHQVSVAALYMLMRKAYDQYVERTTNNDKGDLVTLPFDIWLKQLCVEQPQADYWFKSIKLDLLILQFVKSCYTADFSLYMETLDSLMPWVYSQYARNLPTLPQTWQHLTNDILLCM